MIHFVNIIICADLPVCLCNFYVMVSNESLGTLTHTVTFNFK